MTGDVRSFVSHKPLALVVLAAVLLTSGGAWAQAPRWIAATAGQDGKGEGFTYRAEPIQNGVRVRCTFAGLWSETAKGDGDSFERLSGSALGVSGKIGAPELPAWRRFIEVPLNAENVRLMTSNERGEAPMVTPVDLAARVYPVQPPREKNRSPQDVPFAYHRASYQGKASLRPSEVEIVEAGVFRGRRMYMATVYPVDYTPSSNKLLLRGSVTFDVLWDVPATKAAVEDDRLRSDAYDAVLDPWVLNTDDTATKSTKGLPALPIGYLVIAAPAYVGEQDLLDFVAWKREKGFHVTLVSTDVTGTSTSDIKSYITNAYDNWTVPPTFVLLVGDTDTIPNWVGVGLNNPATDLYYTTVDGTEWNTPDVYLGRFSARSTGDLTNMADKTMTYETGTWPSGQEGWETRAAFLAGNDNYTITEGTHNYVVSTYLDGAGYTSDKLYEVTYAAQTSDITSAVNGGRSLVAFSGHGAETLWGDGPPFSISNIEALTNGITPFVLSFSCLTGTYTVEECFGEAWVRDDYGALAYVGSSVTSYWDEDDIFEKRIFESAFTDDKTWLEGMIQGGKQGLYNHYGPGGTVQRYFEMYNLLGDPSADLFMATAGTLTVSHAAQIPEGAASFTVNVAQDGALVACTLGETLLGTALSSGGSANVSFSESVSTGVVRVTVTLHNYVPYQADVPAAWGADGVVDLDADAYTCPDTVTVQVNDSDLSAEPTQDVTLTTSVDSEVLTLNSTEPGIFSGTITTELAGSGSADGVLQAVDGDTITATYEDLNNGTGNPETKTDTADVDASGPVISSVQVTETTSTSATVTFSTDEPATSRVSCGIGSGGPYPETADNAVLSTSHSLTVNGLAPDTTYYFIVDAWDALGNADAYGAEDTFETSEQPDYFTELFSESDMDLSGMTVTFTPDGSGDYYSAQSTTASALPADPAGGTTVALTDDGYQFVSLTGGEMVRLYGVGYGSFYICANGYLTFLAGDSSYAESLATHFSAPRVSALFEDLNPSSGGTVSWRLLADRLAVTYDAVPAYGGGGENTFQIELFFDGAIRMTWLSLSVTDAVAGLSQGNGLPADFVESDLSEYPAFPVVTAVTRLESEYTNAAEVHFVVTFSESVTGVDVSDFALALGTKAITGASITGVGGSGATYSVTVDTGSGEGTLGLDVLDDDSIENGGGYPLGGTGAGNGGYTDGLSFVIDRTAPMVSAVQVQTGRTVDVVFQDQLMGSSVYDPANYTLSGSGQGTLAANPVSITHVGPCTYRLTWASGAMVEGGDITITVTGVSDAAGNAIGATNFGTDAGGGVPMPVAWWPIAFALAAAGAGVLERRKARRQD